MVAQSNKPTNRFVSCWVVGNYRRLNECKYFTLWHIHKCEILHREFWTPFYNNNHGRIL